MRELSNAQIKFKQRALKQVSILIDLQDLKTVTASNTDLKIDVKIGHFDKRSENKKLAKLIMEYTIDEIINPD